MTADIFSEDTFNPGYLNSITIKGLMSIKDLEELKLEKVNVLIGANGAGKSNFLEAFHLLDSGLRGRLGNYSMRYGDSSGLFFRGPEFTETIELGINYQAWQANLKLGIFRDNEIKLKSDDLVANDLPKHTRVEDMDSLIAKRELRMAERRGITLEDKPRVVNDSGAAGVSEGNDNIRYLTRREIINNSWRRYAINPRSYSSSIFRRADVRDNGQLYPNFQNISPMLLKMKEERPQDYEFLLNAIRLILPVFDDFIFKARRHDDKAITLDLQWRHTDTDFIMQPYHLSKGSLSFIALATCMLQSNPPSVIIIDEPELGLHPDAMELFANLIKNKKQKSQVIIATQSPTLVNKFSPEEIITVNCDGKEGSQFQRLDPKELESWLKDYSIADLWNKNVIQASP